MSLSISIASTHTLASPNEGPDPWADSWPDSNWTDSANPIEWGAYSELALGVFRRASPNPDGNSLAEWRNQFSASRYWGEHYLSAKLDILYDDVDDHSLQFSWRELYIDSPLTDSINVRFGQQVLTWGTGDFVFLNDFFPKNWQAMFSGRDDEYLKAPSASIKLSYYNTAFNADIVWTPQFHPDIYISGERFAYAQPNSREPTNQRLLADNPEDRISNGQLAMRLSKQHNSVEYAAYFYNGFYTQPNSINPENNRYYFSTLNAYGASIRLPAAGGIANAEFAYWQSRDDTAGTDPFRPNSQIKMLLGFERELASEFTLGLQWLSELTLDYTAARSAQPENLPLNARWHHTISLRLNYLSMQQKLHWSLFTFYSPDEGDVYLKPKVSYRHNDHWSFTLGMNEFSGRNLQQQWGQFEPSSNVYLRVRFRF
ncbi:hypothetical protein [Pseudoteredinibacter isoporae]|uniref:hypothetical protein n=1 Tax=Pseudoteredinibacter isoporae TaxID=570281 RepID=UPI00310AA5DE